MADDFWSVILLVLLIMVEGSVLCAAGVASLKSDHLTERDRLRVSCQLKLEQNGVRSTAS